MSERKWPDGPWVWRWKSCSLHTVGTPPYPYGKTVLAPSWSYDGGIDFEISDEVASLLAASPLLYEALEKLERAVCRYGINKDNNITDLGALLTESLPKARAALAAARGDS